MPVRTAAALASLAALGLTVGGCAADGEESEAARPTSFAEHAVVSGSPTADTAAFRTAGRSLRQADHRAIDELGPRPQWERGRTPRARAEANAAKSAADGVALRPSSAARDASAAAHAALPVERTELDGDRVRLVWGLRSVGGPGVKMEFDGKSRRTVTLDPPDLEPLTEILDAHLKDEGQVQTLPAEGRLVITCAAEVERTTLALLDELDVPPPQVEITAKIFEVSHDFDYQQGARLLLSRVADDGAQQALSSFRTERLLEAAEDESVFQGSVVSLMQDFEDAGMSLDATFELLAEAGLIHVVSSPRLTVAQGQTGYMLAGQELPIQSAQIASNAIKTSTEYKPVGVQLYITPQAIGDGTIKLHTTSVVSSMNGFSPLPAIRGHRPSALLVNPIIQSREAETTVTVNDGETLVISGMRMVRTTTREDKVPGLGSLPIIGNLFKNHRSQQHLTDLYFFITPTLSSGHVTTANAE